MAQKNNPLPSMPSTMHDEEAERRLRDQLQKKQDGLRNIVKRLRSQGAPIQTADDLQKMTPSYIRQGIKAQKDKQLSGDFIPQAIRQSYTAQFAQMERQLIPDATTLQDILHSLPLSIHMDDDSNILHFDYEELEAYIAKQSEVAIPEEMRQYFDKIQGICQSWHDLIEWCTQNNLTPPTMRLVKYLTGENGRFAQPPHLDDTCVLSLDSENFFTMYKFGSIGSIKSYEKEKDE